MLTMANLCQYGHVDDFAFKLIMEERKYTKAIRECK